MPGTVPGSYHPEKTNPTFSCPTAIASSGLGKLLPIPTPAPFSGP